MKKTIINTIAIAILLTAAVGCTKPCPCTPQNPSVNTNAPAAVNTIGGKAPANH
jgi:hypothetical protein